MYDTVFRMPLVTVARLRELLAGLDDEAEINPSLAVFQRTEAGGLLWQGSIELAEERVKLVGEGVMA